MKVKKEKIDKFTTLSCSIHTKKLIDLLKIENNKSTQDELLQEMISIYYQFKKGVIKRVVSEE